MQSRYACPALVACLASVVIGGAFSFSESFSFLVPGGFSEVPKKERRFTNHYLRPLLLDVRQQSTAKSSLATLILLDLDGCLFVLSLSWDSV